MAHREQFEFIIAVKTAFPDFFVGKRVLEIGSLDINGSVRRYFEGGSFTGIDVGAGPGVDIVCQGQDFNAPDASYDVTISCEVMEHNPYWRETFLNMLRLCRPGGLVIMTCALLGRREHGTRRTTPRDAPLIEWDFYQNFLARDFTGTIPLKEYLSKWTFCSNLSCCDLYFFGFREGSPAPSNASGVVRAIRYQYLKKNLRDREGLRRRISIMLTGEQRYWEGPLLPWKRVDEQRRLKKIG